MAYHNPAGIPYQPARNCDQFFHLGRGGKKKYARKRQIHCNHYYILGCIIASIEYFCTLLVCVCYCAGHITTHAHLRSSLHCFLSMGS